jgi:S-adenosyl methyltransferase
MTTPRQADDRGGTAGSPRRSRNARACISGRDFAPGVAILGSQVGSRAVDAPWWSFCLLSVLGLAAVCLRIVFPQDSPDKLAWWRERWRTKQRCQCPPAVQVGRPLGKHHSPRGAGALGLAALGDSGARKEDALWSGNRADGGHAFDAQDEQDEGPVLDTSVAHPARVYDYWLGGKDNYAADRSAAEALIAVRPAIVRDIRANRAFMRRTVAYLAAEGVRQFLDIGTGIPTKPNLHEVVQGIAPDARIVYADNDPVVLAHARALLVSTPEGTTSYLHADLRDPGTILQEAARTLDFAQPAAVILASILQLISDTEDPYQIVAQLMSSVARGSYLVLTHPASDIYGELVAESARRYNESVATPLTLRTFNQVASFFDGLELIEPGIVQCHRWHPEPGDSVDDYDVAGWGAVARKP